MNKDDSQLLLTLLDKFMSRQPASCKNEGLAYVAPDGSFGLTASADEPGLNAAYYMMDKLAAAGIFDGKQNKGMELDAVCSRLEPGTSYRIYKEATLCRTDEHEIEVRIKTTRPLKQIFKAVAEAEASAWDDIEEHLAEKRVQQEKIAADRKREKHGPVTGNVYDDLIFVKSYIKDLVEKQFPRSGVSIKEKGLDPKRARLTGDIRPRLVVSYKNPGAEKAAQQERLVNEILPKIFTGIDAVESRIFSGNRLEFEVRGNPSRLAADIMDAREAEKDRVKQVSVVLQKDIPAAKPKAKKLSL